jgi:hypothetical protein
LLELRAQYLDLVAMDVDESIVMAVLHDHCEAGAPGKKE